MAESRAYAHLNSRYYGPFLSFSESRHGLVGM